MSSTLKEKEHSKWRILEISKRKLIIEFAFGHPNGIIEYRRKNEPEMWAEKKTIGQLSSLLLGPKGF